MALVFSDVLERMMKVAGVETQTGLADVLEISPQAITAWGKKGEVPPGAILKTALKYSASVDFIVYGTGKTVSESTDNSLNLACACIEDFALIPKYGTRLSGGPGAFVLSEDIENTLAFKRSWINQRCNKNGCGLFEVVGDSMAPAICHEDIVLVDMSRNDPKEIIEGKVYAFAEGDKVRIKRLIWKGEELWAVSENKAESPDGRVDVDCFRLIGKVIWVGHEVR